MAVLNKRDVHIQPKTVLDHFFGVLDESGTVQVLVPFFAEKPQSLKVFEWSSEDVHGIFEKMQNLSGPFWPKPRNQG